MRAMVGEPGRSRNDSATRASRPSRRPLRAATYQRICPWDPLEGYCNHPIIAPRQVPRRHFYLNGSSGPRILPTARLKEVFVEGPEVEQAHHHTGRQWLDLVLGVSAVSISFISLFLAIHNGEAMERLVQANSWPSVQVTFSTLNQDATPHIHFDIANKGVGPARIESLDVTYNGAHLGDGRAVLNAMLGRTT